jgi:hypothetical protein
MSFFLFVCSKTTFFCKDKYHTQIYRILTGFIVSFTYLEFLNIRLSLDPSFLFPIHLAFTYGITFKSKFYQT